MTGDQQYHRVEGLLFIDGVFVPWGDNQPVQLDSAGHEWRYFGRTDNLTYGYVWAGGTAPTHRPTPKAGVLGGIDYAAPGHGVLYMHTNKGITFDLEAIRRANAGAKLNRFLAMTGNAAVHVPEAEHLRADVWVFVDGKSQFQQRDINATHGAWDVVVPLHDSNRFLTLASSDAGDTYACDWIVFGDPRLELVAEAKETPNRELKTEGSAHDAGFFMALCDGSVRMVHYSIDAETHRRLGNRKDGLAIAKRNARSVRRPGRATTSPKSSSASRCWRPLAVVRTGGHDKGSMAFAPTNPLHNISRNRMMGNQKGQRELFPPGDDELPGSPPRPKRPARQSITPGDWLSIEHEGKTAGNRWAVMPRQVPPPAFDCV